MKHTATLYVADRERNNLMAAFDLKPDYKWFVTPLKVTFEPDQPPTEEMFRQMIEQSKTLDDEWILAIRYMDNLFADPSVKVLSDGEMEMFL